MVNQEKRESKAPHSSGTSLSARNKVKGKVKYLEIEEAIKLASGTLRKRQVIRGNHFSQSKLSKSLPPIPKAKRTSIMTKSAAGDKMRGSNALQQQEVRLSNGEEYQFGLPSNENPSVKKMKAVQKEDGPGTLVASAINTKPSSSLLLSQKDKKLVASDKMCGSTAFEQREVQLSNGEKYQFGLLSNGNPSVKKMKAVQKEDGPGTLVALAINTKPSSSLLLSQKDKKLVASDKMCGSTAFEQREVQLSNGEKYQFGLPSNESPSVRTKKKVQKEDGAGRLVATAINAKPSSSMVMPQKDMNLVASDKMSGSTAFEQREVQLSNGEKYQFGLPSNESPSIRLMKKVQKEDGAGRLVATAINAKPSSSMIMPQKDMNLVASDKMSGSAPLQQQEVHLSKGEKYQFGLPSNESPSIRSMKKVHQSPSNMIMSPKDMKSVASDEICGSAALQQQEVHLSNGEKYQFGLPSNESPSVRSMKTVHQSPSSMIMSQKGMKSGFKLPSELENPKGLYDSMPKQEEKLDCNSGKGTSPKTQKGSALITSSSQKYPPNVPALEIVWEGNFEVLGIPDKADNGIYEGFSARPPARLSRKAYYFSKQIVGVLQFKLCPLDEILPKIFQTHAPDSNDIALYFFPNFERSKEWYYSLSKHMVNTGYALKSCMGHVELLVFPSALLPMDSWKLDGSGFMWGVFCSSRAI